MDYYDPELDIGWDEQFTQAINIMAEWKDAFGFSGREVLEVKTKRSRGRGPTQPSPGMGISWDKHKQKWVAQITYYNDKKKTTVYVGAYEDTVEGVELDKFELQRALDDLIESGKKAPESKMKYSE